MFVILVMNSEMEAAAYGPFGTERDADRHQRAFEEMKQTLDFTVLKVLPVPDAVATAAMPRPRRVKGG